MEIFCGSEDRVIIQDFPEDIKPGEFFSVEIDDVHSEILDNNGFIFKSPRTKKSKKQQLNKRLTILEMEFGQKVVPYQIQLNLNNSDVYLIGKIDSPIITDPQILYPRCSTLTTYYVRQKNNKRKLLNVYFQNEGLPFLKIEKVFDKYGAVICVDTNSGFDASGKKVAVTTALIVKSKDLDDIGLHIESENAIQIVTHNPPPGNPELRGIWLTLGIIHKDYPCLAEGKLAIITDTEFSNIKSWHDRTEPFFDGHKLPVGIDLFYATSDAGGDEFMPNRLMKICDSLSTKKLGEVLSSR